MVWQTKHRIHIGFLWQIVHSFNITSPLLPLVLSVCRTRWDCKPCNSTLHVPAAWLDGDLTWIMSCTACTVLITIIIIDFTGLWIKLWRNTFASHYFRWWSSACALWADDGGWSRGRWGTPPWWLWWQVMPTAELGRAEPGCQWVCGGDPRLEGDAASGSSCGWCEMREGSAHQVNQVIFPFLTSPWILWIKAKNTAKLKQIF